MDFYFIAEAKKAMVDVPIEFVKKFTLELETQIKARELGGVCDCGTPCKNRVAHDAIDKILLIEIKMMILKRGFV